MRGALRSLVGLTVFSLAAPHANADLWIVDALGLGDFTDVQAAVTQAVDGDVILVHAGTFPAFVIDNESLTVAAQPGCVVRIGGTIEVRNLSAQRTVVLAGLQAIGAQSVSAPGPGLRLVQDLGNVRLQSCTFQGALGWPGNYPGGPGGEGAIITNSVRVVASSTSFLGGHGFSSGYACFDCTGGDGGDGVRALNSSVAFYDCIATGGHGGSSGEHGGNGGEGYRVDNYGLFASGSHFEGGAGGDADDYLFAQGGNGGDGLFVTPDAQAQLLDNVYIGGEEGYSSMGPQFDGEEGEPTAGGGVIHLIGGAARRFEATWAASDAGVLVVTVTGQPGDRVWLAKSPGVSFFFTPASKGVWTLDRMLLPTPSAPGTIPSSGTLTLQVALPDAGAAGPVQRLFLQGVVRDPQDATFLASPFGVLIVDCAAPGADCNGNGTNDTCDLLSGSSPDCDQNGLPDACDIDCNANAVPDACDLAQGTSLDCDGNTVPDECQSLPDCNQNGVADACDISSHTSFDCNHNFVPDECDLPDCNNNNRPDSCDIAIGSSNDFNGDGIPDECQIVYATWYVDDSAAPGGDGSSAFPFQSISQGINATILGDTVIVRDGLYVGAANREMNTGGRGITIRSENGPAACIIDCQLFGRAFTLSSGSLLPIEIRGFTIRNCRGAVHCLGSELTIAECRIQNSSNESALLLGYALMRVIDCEFSLCTNMDFFNGLGGAIYAVTDGNNPQSGLFEIRGCTFRDGAAKRGGAVFTHGNGTPVISHCIFENNVATVSGGAIASATYSYGTTPGLTVVDCRITGNYAPDGGGIHVWQQASGTATPLILAHSTLTANRADFRGGALWIEGGLPFTSATVQDCIVWGDIAPSGFEIATSGLLTVRRSDVKGGINNLFVAGGSVVWGSGNFALNPQFVDPDGPDGNPGTYSDNDLRLAGNSPCIDAGDNSLATLDVLDLDGDGVTAEPVPFDLDFEARFVDDPNVIDTGVGTPPICDLGCYER